MTGSAKEQFQELFTTYLKSLNGEATGEAFQLRSSAFEKLGEMQFPGRRDENWKYTALAPVLRPKYRMPASTAISEEHVRPFFLPLEDHYRYVFVDGIFREDLSDSLQPEEGVKVAPMRQALEDDTIRGKVTERFRHWNELGNPFVNLNTAFAGDGMYLSVKAGTIVSRPLHFLYLSGEGEEVLSNPQRFLDVGANCRLDLVDSYMSIGSGRRFVNVHHDTQLGPNAILHHYRIQDEGEAAYLVNHSDVYQEADSTYSSYGLDLGGKLVRNNLYTHLEASGTHTDLFGVYLAGGSQHIDNQTFLDHAYPHCTSNELYKGIIRDKAQGVFNGKVIVRPDAQKTNAFQQNSNLVLSEKAKMNTKPQLEIFADDVKCSHGATVGQLDENSLYYLRSRGLTKRMAETMLQHAFVSEVISEMPLDEMAAYADTLVTRKFGW